MAMGARREETSSDLQSNDEEEGEEGEVTPPPLSPPCETLPSFGDILNWLAGVAVSVCRPKWTQTKTGPSVGMPP
jgi:hypothetical protein